MSLAKPDIMVNAGNMSGLRSPPCTPPPRDMLFLKADVNASTLVLSLISLPCPLSCPLSCTPAPQPIRGDRETESGRDADVNRCRCVYDFTEKTE